MREIILPDEKATEDFGLELAQTLVEGDVLALIGDLGTGKTTLTKYIAKGLAVEETITSPTFTIVNEYHSGRLPLFHFDAYRLSGADEAFEAGIEEYFYRNGVCIVEWADIIEEILPENAKKIYMEYGPEDGERIFKCTF